MNKKKKKALLVFLAVLGALFAFIVVCGVIVALLNKPNDEDMKFPTDHFLFERPDWDADIMSDPDYLDADRTIVYENSGESYPLTAGASSRASAEIFFAYFDAIRAGNCEAYDALFSQDYRSDHSSTEPFTMQRIYDIEVSFRGSDADDGKTTDYYVIRYKIMKNDGTFRRDIDSDSTRDQILSLIETDEGWKIDKISFYAIS